jgi:hypothetical protein
LRKQSQEKLPAIGERLEKIAAERFFIDPIKIKCGYLEISS